MLVSQLVLKEHVKILALATVSGSSWAWHVRRLLNLNLKQILSSVKSNSTESMAVSLRVIEVFTSFEITQKVLGYDKARMLLAKEFGYLVEKGYFRSLRYLLDEKTPPLLAVSTKPPTPLVGCLFEMISRPLQIGSNVSVAEFRFVQFF